MTALVLFRCNGVGVLGHINRCIALAEALREIGWNAIFRSALDDNSRALLAEVGFEHSSTETQDRASDTLAMAAGRGASWIVLDGYEFTPEYAESLAGAGAKVAVIDDFADWPRYPVDVVLNFTVAAISDAYPATSARLLMGPEYFLARARLRRRRRARSKKAPSKLCIALRGDADAGRTASVLEALRRCNLHVRPLIPDGAAHRDRIVQLLAGMLPESRLRLVPHDTSEDLAWSDIALCTGGLIKYEAIFLGAFPLVISNTRGEAGDTAAWLSRGIGANLGLMADFDRNRVAQAVMQLVQSDPESLLNAVHRGQRIFGDDPTLRAAHALTTSVHAQAK